MLKITFEEIIFLLDYTDFDTNMCIEQTQQNEFEFVEYFILHGNGEMFYFLWDDTKVGPYRYEGLNIKNMKNIFTKKNAK